MESTPVVSRVENWEKRLKDVIEKHHRLPSEYGVSDCYLIVDDAVEAVTGQRMFSNVSYNSEIGAAKELRKRGFNNVEEAFTSKFVEIPVALAQRGDIGTILNSNNEICGGVFTSVGFMVRSEKHILFISLSEVKTAFKVGR